MRLLIGYDGSDCSEEVLRDLARSGLPADVAAEVMTVRDLPPAVAVGEATFDHADAETLEYFRREREAAEAEALRMAERAATTLSGQFPQWTVTTCAAFGSPHGELIRRAEAWPADLLAVGSNGRGAMGRAIFGSVAQACVHHCHRSLRICRTSKRKAGPGTPLTLLLATDGSPASMEATRVVASRQWPAGTSVRVLSLVERTWSVDDPKFEAGTELVMELSAEARDAAHVYAEQAVAVLSAAGLKATAASRDGYPRHDIVEHAEAEGADAIFLGATGRRLLGRLLIGSVAASVAANAKCSVEIVRPRS